MNLETVIRQLQKKMNELGENLVVDGQFGPKTQYALEKYDVQISLTEKPDGPPVWQNLEPALTLIKEFEGLYLNAYKDPVGIPTIGWGTIKYPNGQKVKMGDKITKDQAEEYLRHEVMGFVQSVKNLVKVPISNNAFCALVSFCYNLGAGALGGSTLLKKLNSGESMESVAGEFGKWVHAGGKVLPGLVRRREAEKNIFLS